MRKKSFLPAFYVAIAAAVIGCICVLVIPKIKPVDKVRDAVLEA